MSTMSDNILQFLRRVFLHNRIRLLNCHLKQYYFFVFPNSNTINFGEIRSSWSQITNLLFPYCHLDFLFCIFNIIRQINIGYNAKPMEMVYCFGFCRYYIDDGKSQVSTLQIRPEQWTLKSATEISSLENKLSILDTT